VANASQQDEVIEYREFLDFLAEMVAVKVAEMIEEQEPAKLNNKN